MQLHKKQETWTKTHAQNLEYYFKLFWFKNWCIHEGLVLIIWTEETERFKGRHSKQIGEGEEDIYVSNKDLNLQSNSELLWEMEALLYSENMLMLNIQNVNQTK